MPAGRERPQGERQRTASGADWGADAWCGPWSRALRGGRVEADLGRFALGRGGNFEKLAGLEAEHPGKNIRGELLDFGVEVADNGVVIAARVLDGVLDLRQGILQRSETLDGAKFGIRLGKCKEAFQRAGEHRLRWGLVIGR